jgi:DNA (cytosine-5)-methyltransferase 1
MMGLPDGWVTGVPGIDADKHPDGGERNRPYLTRNEQLKALGNGVVPQQAEAALRHLLSVLGRAS